MRIAIDAMGGDHAPNSNVDGALLAVNEHSDIEVVLVGDQSKIEKLLPPNVSRIKVVHTSEVIGTDEEAVKAVRTKKDSSLVQVTKMVKEKEVDACISAGNTGAYMTAGLLVTGRMKGIERPGLSIFFPTTSDKPSLILDVGANMDAKPEHLLQYAKMGRIYAEKVLGYENPSVGLLNVGTEETKGNELTKATFPLLRDADINFVGNVEARDVPFGIADVIVCDGFAGNVLLKSTEGVAAAIFSMLKEELIRNAATKIGTLLLKPGLKRLKAKLDYAEYGGAPLLGLNGVCIKAHGSSSSIAIKNAIGQARKFLINNVTDLIKREVQKESEDK
jgi:glycerol-3-phosphate acyltransferase PlsX